MKKPTGYLTNPENERTPSLSRREMLRLALVAPVCAGFGSLLAPAGDAKAMIYLPKQERMWDSWMLYHHDTFYLFHLSVEANNPDTSR